MRSFVFFGRLVPEKGFDLLFPFFETVFETGRGRVAVFGEGPLSDAFLSRFSPRKGFFDFRSIESEDCARRFASLPPGSVAYFGRRPYRSISETLAVADISLMPSTFLETFGLSALESLSAGVPVAGFSKGGIVPFLLSDELKISERSPSGSLVSLLTLSDGKIAEWKNATREVALRYSEERFRERLSEILPASAKKILLVTDFLGSIGGIETYVRNLESTLREFGYEVRTEGAESGFSTRFEKILSTAVSFFNPGAKRELSEAARAFAPDVVWCHSVLRRYGPIGLDAVFEVPAFRMMTYHDLGYFAPFASECRSESDVPKPGFAEFVKKAPGMARKVFAIFKYAKLAMLFSRLRRFDVHLVPSEFIVPFVRGVLPESHIVVLPHYVTKPCKQ